MRNREWLRKINSLIQIAVYKFCLIGLVIILGGFTSSYSQEIRSWSGEYSYYAEYPKHIGITRLDGSKVAGTELGIGGIVYTLYIDSLDNSFATLNESLFYYPEDTINCKVIYNHDSASFLFKDFGNNRLRNKLYTEEFKQGQLLFTLEHTKNNQFITHWHGLNPSVPTLSSFIASSYLTTSNHLASFKVNKSGQIYSDTLEYHTDGFIKIEKVDLTPVFSNPDTEVSRISLLNDESARSVIGGNYNLDKEDKVSYLSSDSKQKLTLSFHPGDVKYQFSEIEVSWTKANDDGNTIPVSSFKTNNGIHLGMTKEEIVRKLGNHFILHHPKNGVYLYYEVDDMPHSDFLKKNNMPHYYAKYYLQQDILIRYKFGFEYP